MGRRFEICTINELRHILHLADGSRQIILALDEIVKGVGTPAKKEDEDWLVKIMMKL
jgi:hypothetical protein